MLVPRSHHRIERPRETGDELTVDAGGFEPHIQQRFSIARHRACFGGV